jgi:hypothetical protein
MTRILTNGLRILTVAAITTGLTLSAMAQQTGSQPVQTAPTAGKTAPAVDAKKPIAPVATTIKGNEAKPQMPATGSQPQAATTGTGSHATGTSAAAPAATAPAAGNPVQHDSKAVGLTTEKKPGG